MRVSRILLAFLFGPFTPLGVVADVAKSEL